MTKDDIITLPNKALREKSHKVNIISDDIKSVIEGMKSATTDWENSRTHEVGVALAAIQVNKPYKIIVIRNDFDNKDDHTFSVLINPEITKHADTIEEDYEGCLSISDIYGKVPRYSKVRVKAINEDGREVRINAEGFLARVLQHEIDHVNGVTFIDHIKDDHEAFFKLTESGSLEKLSYAEHVAGNKTLWE